MALEIDMNTKELLYYYALHLAMKGVRFDAEGDEEEEQSGGGKKSGAGTRLPYGLAKGQGIDIPNGTTPHEAWEILEGKTGVKAKDVYSKIKETGSPKGAFNQAKAEVESKKSSGGIDPEQAWLESLAESGESVEKNPVNNQSGNAEKTGAQKINEMYENNTGNYEKPDYDEIHELVKEMPVGMEFIDAVGDKFVKTDKGWNSEGSDYFIQDDVFAYHIADSIEGGYKEHFVEPVNEEGSVEASIPEEEAIPMATAESGVEKSPIEKINEIIGKGKGFTESDDEIASVVQSLPDGTIYKVKTLGGQSIELEKNGSQWIVNESGSIYDEDMIAMSVSSQLKAGQNISFYDKNQEKQSDIESGEEDSAVNKANDLYKNLSMEGGHEKVFGEVSEVISNLPVGTSYVTPEGFKFTLDKGGVWMPENSGMSQLGNDMVSDLIIADVSAGEKGQFIAPSSDKSLTQKEFIDQFKEAINMPDPDGKYSHAELSKMKPALENVFSKAAIGQKIGLKNGWHSETSYIDGGTTFEKIDNDTWESVDTGEVITDGDIAEGAYFNKYFSGTDPEIESGGAEVQQNKPKLSNKEMNESLGNVLGMSEPGSPYPDTASYEAMKPELEKLLNDAEVGTKINMPTGWYPNGYAPSGVYEKTKIGDTYAWENHSNGKIVGYGDLAEGIYSSKFSYKKNPQFVAEIQSKASDPMEQIKDVIGQAKDDVLSVNDVSDVVKKLPVGTVFKYKDNGQEKEYVKVYSNDWFSNDGWDLIDNTVANQILSDAPKGEEISFGKQEAITVPNILEKFEDKKNDYGVQGSVTTYLNTLPKGKMISVGDKNYIKTYNNFSNVEDYYDSISPSNLAKKMLHNSGFATFKSPNADALKGNNSDKYYSSCPATDDELKDVLEGVKSGDVSAHKLNGNDVEKGTVIDVNGEKYVSLGNGVWDGPDITSYKNLQGIAHKIHYQNPNEINVGHVDLPEIDISQTYGVNDNGEVVPVTKLPATEQEINDVLMNIVHFKNGQFNQGISFDNVPPGTKINIQSAYKDDNGYYTKQEDGSWKKSNAKHTQGEASIKGHLMYANNVSVQMPKTAKEGGKHTLNWLQLKTSELEKKIAKTPDGDEKNALQAELDKYKEEMKPKQEAAEAKKKEQAKKKKIAQLTSQKDNIQSQYDNYKNGYEEAKQKVYEGIWHEPVTIADYEAKKDSIEAKKEYYAKKLKYYQGIWNNAPAGSAEEAEAQKNKDRINKHIADLTDFETKAKQYSENNYQKKCEQYEKRLSEMDLRIEDVNNGGNGNLPFNYEGVFSEDAYTDDRKNNALWDEPILDKHKYFAETCSGVWKDLPQKQKDALYSYTGSYSDVNETLRGFTYGQGHGKDSYIGPENIDWNGVGTGYAGKTPKYIRDKVANITKAIDQSWYDKDMWLQRGIDSGLAEYIFQGKVGTNGSNLMSMSEDEIAEAIGVNDGRVSTEYAFGSCGIHKGKGFTGNDVILNIYCPAGTKMMYLEPFSQYGNGHHGSSWNGEKLSDSVSAEAEMLLQQGTMMRPTKVKKANGKIYIDVEVVGQNPNYPDEV